MHDQISQSKIDRSSRVLAAQRLADWFLIVTGVVGFAIGSTDLFLNVDQLGFLKETQAIVLLLLGLLAFAVGLERRTTLEDARHNIERLQLNILAQVTGLGMEIANMQQTLVSSVAVRRLMDEDEVFEEIKRIVNAGEDNQHIRATGLNATGVGAVPIQATGFSRRYVAVYAQRVKEAQERRGSMTYRVVLTFAGGDATNPPPRTKTRITMRREIFAEQEINQNRLRLRYLMVSWPLDMLIIGDSVVVGFSTITGLTNITFGLRITDKALVGAITQWYDDALWDQAEPVTWDDGPNTTGSNDLVSDS
ncbi:MAG TPA: hypothetical protein VF952_19670 [Chloroflexia bacterium]|jgi:hypothetical protein